jgi:hypothetical protein
MGHKIRYPRLAMRFAALAATRRVDAEIRALVGSRVSHGDAAPLRWATCARFARQLLDINDVMEERE